MNPRSKIIVLFVAGLFCAHSLAGTTIEREIHAISFHWNLPFSLEFKAPEEVSITICEPLPDNIK